MSALTGWGRQGWGSGGWGEAAPVEPTGVAITSSVGTASISLSNIGQPSGVAVSVGLGSVSGVPGTNVNATGVEIRAIAGTLFLWFPIDTSQTPNYTPIER